VKAINQRPSNILTLHIVRFFSTLYFYHHVVSIYLVARGLSFLEINSLWGIIVLVQAIFEVPTGIIADRVGRKLSIQIALALQLAGELIFLFGTGYPHFILSCIAGGIGFSFLSGSFEAMMYDSLKEVGAEGDMQKVAGFNGSLSLLAMVIGTFTGGVVTASLEFGTIRLAIIMTSVFVGMSLVSSGFLKEPAAVTDAPKKSSLALLKDSLGLLRKDKKLVKIVVLALFSTPFINYLINLYSPHFQQIGVSGAWFGPTLAIASLLGFFASKYAYLLEELLGVKWAVLAATVTPGVFYILLFSFVAPGAAVPLVIVGFAIMQIQKPIFLDYVNRKIQTEIRATVLSLISALSGAYVALMGLGIGALADVSIRGAFLLMGVIVTLCAIFMRISEGHVTTSGDQPS
jgi:MFS family permease